MSTCDILKHERGILIFEHFMTKFHELPKQPSYIYILWKIDRILLSVLIKVKNNDSFHP